MKGFLAIAFLVFSSPYNSVLTPFFGVQGKNTLAFLLLCPYNFCMKLNEKQMKAIQMFIQALLTSLFVLLETVLTGCISNKDGTITQNNDFSVPIVIPNSSAVGNSELDGVDNTPYILEP